MGPPAERRRCSSDPQGDGPPRRVHLPAVPAQGHPRGDHDRDHGGPRRRESAADRADLRHRAVREHGRGLLRAAVSEPPAAVRLRGTDDRDPDRVGHRGHRSDLPRELRRPARDAGPPQRPVPPPPVHAAAVLHDDPDRGDPVASRERRRWRADRGHRHRVEHPVEHRRDRQHADRDAVALLAAHRAVVVHVAVLPVAHLQGGQGAPRGRGEHAEDPGGPDGGHRGDAVGVGDPPVQGLRTAAARDRAVPGREPAADATPDPSDDDRPILLRRRRHVLLDHAGSRLPGGRLGERRQRSRDHGGRDRRVHDAAGTTVLPDRPDAAGQHRGAVLPRAVRSDLRVSGSGARDHRRSGRRRPGSRRDRGSCRAGARLVPLRSAAGAGDRTGARRRRGCVRRPGAPGVDPPRRRPGDRARTARGARGPQRSREDHDHLPRPASV